MTDLIINKAFRTIDRVVEFETSGTLIDVVNRAHKRGLVENADQARLLKDLRNQVAHEYAGAELIAIYHSVLNHTPTLLSIVNKTKSYADSLLKLT